MKIYKDDIIDALETEPLHAGSWITSDRCAACAVGNVVRRYKPEGPIGDLCAELTENRYRDIDCASGGNWLSALSIVWEYLNNNNREKAHIRVNPEEFRQDIIDWAEDNIPEDYVVEIGA